MNGIGSHDERKKVKPAARTIIVDEENDKIAILEVKHGAFHKIPGGGVEDNESIEDAAIREAFEESSCDVELIAKLGESEFENPDVPGLFHHSVCFLAKKLKDHKTLHFDEWEKENHYKLVRVTFDDAIKLFESITSTSPFDVEMNNRDLQFVKTAKAYVSKNQRN